MVTSLDQTVQKKTNGHEVEVSEKPKIEYAIGDLAWIATGRRDGKLSGGSVVHRFKLDDYNHSHYVVEIETSVDPVLYVREWWTMSQDSEGPLGWLRKSDILPFYE